MSRFAKAVWQDVEKGSSLPRKRESREFTLNMFKQFLDSRLRGNDRRMGSPCFSTSF
jgi:hypothetical protein